MSPKRHERTGARIHAVQVLYTSDIQGKKSDALLDEGLCLLEDGSLSDYALRLIRGTEACSDELDARIEEASENWTLSRMPIVDRAILRLATYEMLHENDVPISVSINEAVELAKSLGGEEDSPRFVNGVLGRIARSLEGSKGDEGAHGDALAGALVGASGAAAVVQVEG